MKYKKYQKGRVKGLEHRCNKIQIGFYAIQTLETYRLTEIQLKTIRFLISKLLKNKGKFWFRVYPDLPITSKTIGSRMGKGKGSVETKVVPVKPGQIILEFNGIPLKEAKVVYKYINYKMPVKTKFIKKNLNQEKILV